MTNRWGGMGTVAIAAAVSTCGLFMLGGVAPTATIAPADGETDDTIADATSFTATSTPTTEPAPDLTAAEPTTNTSPDGSTTTTSTTTTTTTTTTTDSSTTTTTAAPIPVPPTVTASTTIVGVGGTVTFEGNCGNPAGPVVIWIVREADGSTEVVDTDLTTSPWTYTWHAPVDERDVSSFDFRFGCGTPGDDAGASPPTTAQARVDMVASAAPSPAAPTPTTTPTTPGRPASVDQILPETD